MTARRLRLRVYRDGRIVVHVDAPQLGTTLSSSTFAGWANVLRLVDRCAREWEGLEWDLVVRHQGILL